MKLTHLLLALTALAAQAADFPEPFDTEKSTHPRMSAEQTARSMRLSGGFNAAVFAAEPDVRQPIGACFDTRGRLWVAENYTYAENPQRWDTKLRDRIVIFEDKDGDGKADERKVFWDQGLYLTSVECGFGGVWALCPPQLLFIPDKDGDDVPDGEPQVMLDGWNYQTIGHNIVNGLKWGPDGWLYGRHGITDNSLVGAPGTPDKERTRLNCSIWRFHPVTHQFEVVCNGGTNPWGFDFDEHGQMFYTNTVIGHLWHVIPGAYYRRMFGVHLNPHVYEIIEQTADHFHWDSGPEKWSDLRDKPMSASTDKLGGGHAHVGGMIYLGDNWPERYRNGLFTCNLHGHRINMDRLEREGCGYVGKHGADFMLAQDQWFRGIELLTGPDGGVFVLDWSDDGECHDNDGVHRTSGRIYKITYNEPRKVDAFDLAKATASDLVQWQVHPNDWWSRQARRILQERAAAGENMDEVKSKLRALYATATDAPRQLRLMWALYAVGAADEPWLAGQLDDESEHVRTWAIRLLGESSTVSRDTTAKLTGMCASDPSGLARLFLASYMRNRPNAERWPMANALAEHAEDAEDRQQPLMIWYGVEPIVPTDSQQALDLIAASKIPTVTRLVARRLTEEIENQPAAVDGLVAMLLQDGVSSKRADIVNGMHQALQGWSKAPKPRDWEAVTEKLSTDKNDPLAAVARELSAVFGSGRAMDELMAIARDDEADAKARRAALKALLVNPTPDLLPLLKKWARDKILSEQAVRGMASFDDPGVPATLIASFPKASDSQTNVVDTLISRPSYAQQLLDAVEKGRIPRTAISAFQARHIQNLGDEALSRKLAAVWGEIRDTPEAKRAEMDKWKKFLAENPPANANPSAGRAVFDRTCALCHKLFGQGGAVGPELTGSDRGNLDFLLQNIVDPSAVLPNDFRMTVFTLKDGRIITGVIAEQTDRMLTIQTPAERLAIERTAVAKKQVLSMSFMPEGLLEAMSKNDVRDLFAYLSGKQQVEPPAGP